MLTITGLRLPVETPSLLFCALHRHPLIPLLPEGDHFTFKEYFPGSRVLRMEPAFADELIDALTGDAEFLHHIADAHESGEF